MNIGVVLNQETSMRELKSIFGMETLKMWAEAQQITVHPIDWSRARDPQAPRLGRYAVTEGYEFNDSQLSQWRASITQDSSWILASQTRHRPLPSHLLTLHTEKQSSTFFYSSFGKQLGKEQSGEQIYADLHPDFCTLLEQWLSCPKTVKE